MGYYTGKILLTKAISINDADALAFIATTGLTDEIQLNAINTLVTDLKKYNIWSKMKAIYPFIGGTEMTHKFNLKDPRDLNSAFRLTFTGGWEHTLFGVKADGTTGYANTNMNALSNTNQNSISFCVYNRENIAKGCDIGCENYANSILRMMSKYSDGNTYVEINNPGTYGVNLSINASGCFISTRLLSTQHKTYRNGTLILTDTKASESPPDKNIIISASMAHVPVYYDTKQKSFTSIGDGLTETEVTNLNATVQRYNTILGRQV